MKNDIVLLTLYNQSDEFIWSWTSINQTDVVATIVTISRVKSQSKTFERDP